MHKNNKTIDFLNHQKTIDKEMNDLSKFLENPISKPIKENDLEESPDFYNLSKEQLNTIAVNLVSETFDLKEQLKKTDDRIIQLVVQVNRLTEDQKANNRKFDRPLNSISEDTINKLLNKIASLENKVEELSRYLPKQVVTDEIKSSLTDHLEEQNNKSPDFIKILQELKIRSLATSILFLKSNFECADKINKNIAFSFKDPAYIEMANQKIDVIKESVKYVLGCDYNVIIYLKEPTQKI